MRVSDRLLAAALSIERRGASPSAEELRSMAGELASLESQKDDREKLLRERDNLLSYLKGISRQTAEMVKAHS